jgi:hypothetical protein
MRTDIVLDRNEQGEWDKAAGYISVRHDAPLTAEQVEVFRELGRLVRERMEAGSGSG